MNKITLYRFSQDGFLPLYQQYHANGIENLSNTITADCKDYPEHLRHHIIRGFNDILPNWKDYSCGLFTFVGSMPFKKQHDYLLNHLNDEQKQSYQWWSAEISEDEYCFEVYNNQLWKKTAFTQIKNIISKQEHEIFIPSQFLNLENIIKISPQIHQKKQLKF